MIKMNNYHFMDIKYIVLLVVIWNVVKADEDLYKVLGVDRSASPKTIKQAYKNLAKEWYVWYLWTITLHYITLHYSAIRHHGLSSKLDCLFFVWQNLLGLCGHQSLQTLQYSLCGPTRLYPWPTPLHSLHLEHNRNCFTTWNPDTSLRWWYPALRQTLHPRHWRCKNKASQLLLWDSNLVLVNASQTERQQNRAHMVHKKDQERQWSCSANRQGLLHPTVRRGARSWSFSRQHTVNDQPHLHGHQILLLPSSLNSPN